MFIIIIIKWIPNKICLNDNENIRYLPTTKMTLGYIIDSEPCSAINGDERLFPLLSRCRCEVLSWSWRTISLFEWTAVPFGTATGTKLLWALNICKTDERKSLYTSVGLRSPFTFAYGTNLSLILIYKRIF